MDLLYILEYYSTACVYFSFRWGPFVHSLGIIQWNFTRRTTREILEGYPGRVLSAWYQSVRFLNSLGLYIAVRLIQCFVYLPNLIIGTDSVL